MLLKNPCEECIIKVVCCNLCDECKAKWENSMTCDSNKYILNYKYYIGDDRKTIHWWFEKLIKFIEEEKGN